MIFSIVPLAIAALASSVAALPTGAPKCAINATVIEAAHGIAPDASLGWDLSVTSTATGWDVSVINTAGKKTYNGVLMYVVVESDLKTHLGKFDIDTSLFRYTKPEVCAAANIKGPVEATFTHANPKPKPVSTVFKFTPNPADFAAVGKMFINFAVADTDKKSAKGAPEWFTKRFYIDDKDDFRMKKMGYGTPMGEPMIRKVIKCKPKSMMSHTSYDKSLPKPVETPMSKPSYGMPAHDKPAYGMPMETPASKPAYGASY
ncbi:hypothetical protein BC831DRAFT_467979 [Entophlyctis helioformis]|nr:hypothetical protein BC831DRAFT_467979 [Entophlyctis helioformis]